MDEAGVPPAPTGAADDARAATVRRASSTWQRQLVDLSGRNRLLYYRDQQVGTIDLGAANAPADPVAVDQLLAGSTVTLTRLFADPTTDAVECTAAIARQAKRARTVAAKASEMFEERGIRTLFLAVGMAHWTETQSAAQPAAPVVLFPLELKPRGSTAEDFDVKTVGDPQVSPTLLEKLATDFSVRISAAELDDLLLVDGGPGAEGWPIAELLDRLEKEVDAKVPGFTISERIVIANFSYHKLPMVKDLEACERQLVEHDLVAAIAGDEAARAAVAARDHAIDVDPALPDRQPPADEFLVVDADGTQSYAINAALAGSNLVVKGPPGTGKSQTIANLITTLAARRQRVLFVAEKRAAIDAVLKRLDAEDLGHLVMDLHHRAQSRRLIAQDLQAALDASATTPLVDLTTQQAALVARRERLNRYTEALHRVRDPWGESLFTILRSLPGIDPAARIAYRFPAPDVRALGTERAGEAAQAIRNFVGLGGFPAPGEPWAGAQLTSPDHVRAALDAVTKLKTELPAWRPVVKRMTDAVGLRPPTTFDDAHQTVALVAGVQQTIATVDEDLFQLDLAELAVTLDKSWFARTFSGDYRPARKTVDACWKQRHPVASPHQVLETVTLARDQADHWRERSVDHNRPRAVTGVDEVVAATDSVGTALADLIALVPDVAWAELAFDDLVAQLDAHAKAHAVAIGYPELHRLWARIRELGVDGCYRACTAPRESGATVPGPRIEEAFRYAWLSSICDHELIGEPELVGLKAEFHDEVVNEFRRADEAHVDSGAARVRRAVAEWIVETRNEFGEQSALIAREAAKSRRHIPLRRLFTEAPDMLTALKPCWAMSPLEVSQLLPGDRQYFDVVVFDEASQVTPADAIPSILRGERVVVAGDQQQLPPTAFFLGTDEDPTPEDEYDDVALGAPLDTGTAGFESILDVLSAILPSRTLGWHYRSQDERLIAFSNVYFYDQSLLTFPGLHGAECLHHLRVPAPAAGLDANQSAAGEVTAVVEAIIEHATTRPNESLGVIALGQVHAERINELLRRTRAEHPELDGFFDGSSGVGQDEPFFVKNLERVQGDERDAIILSIGYGKRNANGRLTYHFGPILTEKGERRLNVAITRARRRLTLASTFGAEDLDPARANSRGVELLRRYLQYVASGGNDLGSGPKENPKLNPFEIDVRDRLTAAGIPVIAQYGVSGYSIDFVATDRDQPGRMVLAIECDGASYHSRPTARDRDRLRQQQLERLGWRFHRIWSTDWFADPVGEVQRVVEAYERALNVPTASAPVLVSPTVAPSTTRPRDLRPDVEPGHPVSDYTADQLVAVATWIESDTLLRTEDELVEVMMDELGFKRRGRRIDERLHTAARLARSGTDVSSRARR